MRRLFVLFLFIGLLGCTQNTAYRTQANNECELDVDGKRTQCAIDAFYRVDGGSVRAWMSILEFDDLGYIQNWQTYRDTIRAIEEQHTKSAHGTLLVLFVHGWKNNAASDNGNLQDFEQALLQLARLEKARYGDEARHVVGAYLGWRGRTFEWPDVANQITFWNRKERAHRVGQNGASVLLADLDRINTRFGDGDNNRFIALGHSFGAAVLFEATYQRMVQNLVDKAPERTVPRTIADAIILVNPAFEAARIHNLLALSAFNDYPETQRPILMQFTSQGDNATKKFFRFGRWFSEWITTEREAEHKTQNTTALGHYQPHIQYDLATATEAPTSNLLELLEDLVRSSSFHSTLSRNVESSICAWRAFNDNQRASFTAEGLTLTRRDPALDANPYMMVSVSEEIIEGHSDIWPSDGEMQSNFLRFIFEVLSIQNSSDYYSTACK